MRYILFLLALLAVIFGAVFGRMREVSAAALSSCSDAVMLCITLTGALCLWSGLMEIAEQSGLTAKITKLLLPVTSRLFKGVNRHSPAMRYITMNITANLFGLGNAATPLGIAAMTDLAKDAPALEDGGVAATDDMVLFTVINTASIQIIPATIAALRMKYGSSSPFDIIPAIIICSVSALTVAVICANLLNRFFPIGKMEDKNE